jgi:hypothetical protein
LSRLQSCIAKIGYERRADGDNNFHGNLLYSENCGKPVEKMIASVLGLESQYIPRS